METKLIDGNELARGILDQIRAVITTSNLKLKLAIIKIGSDKATEIYVRNKIKRATEVGILTQLIELEPNTTQDDLINWAEKLNKDTTVTGYFIQTPIPKHLNLNAFVKLIDPRKDVDGMNPLNLGLVFQNNERAIVAAAAEACIYALRSIPNYSLTGKNVVIVNNSTILGKPLAALLLNENATVTVCHAKTKELKTFTKLADVAIVGTGQPSLIDKDFIKEGAVLIDCGSPEAEVVSTGNKSVLGAASYLTPVPGGIGPLTIACLLKNCLTLYRNKDSLN